MSAQLPLSFAPAPPSPPTGRQRRDAALAQLEATTSREWLASMRAEAERLARQHGTVTADNLREYAEALRRTRGLVASHPNAWGTIFTARVFEWTGQIVPSVKPTHNGTSLRVWRLR